MTEQTFQKFLSQRVQEATQQSLNGLRDVAPINPDVMGEALTVRDQEMPGTSALEIAQQPELIRQRADDKRTLELLKKNPALVRWLDVPENAALSQDELDQLAQYKAQLEAPAQDEGGDFTRGLQAGAIQYKKNWAGRTATMTESVRSSLEEAVGDIQVAREATTSGEMLPEGSSGRAQFYSNLTAAELDELEVDLLEKELGSDEFINYLTDVIQEYNLELIAQGEMIDFTDVDSVGKFVDYLQQNTGQMLPSAAESIVAGLIAGPTGAFVSGAATGTGEMTAERLESGGDISDEAFKSRRAVAALGYGAMDIFGFGKVGTKLRNGLAGASKEAVDAAMKRWAKETGKTAVEEGLAEIGQGIMAEWAKEGRPLSEITAEDWEGKLNEFAAGFFGGAAIGGGTTAPQAVAGAAAEQREKNAADRALVAAESVEQLNQAVANTKMRDRNPKKFRQFLQSQGVDEQMLYVDPKPLLDYVTANPTVARLLGVTQDKLAAAVADGTTVPISRVEYLVNIPGKHDEVAAIFAQHSRYNPEAMSREEAETFVKTVQPEMQAEQVMSMDTAAVTETLRQQAVARVMDQLVAAGQSRAAARMGAELHGSFLTAMAARYGDNSVFSTFDLDIGGPGRAPTDGRVLNQNIDAPAENTLLGPDGTPLRVYHSTNQQFDNFDDGRIMFTNQPGFAAEHALTRYGLDPNNRVIEANVAFDNEITFEAPSGVSPDGYYHRIAAEVEEALTTGGHDGAIIYNPEGEAIIVATANSQVRQLGRQLNQSAVGADTLTNLDPETGDTPDRISTRLPWTARATEDPMTENLLIGLDAMKASPEAFAFNMDVLKNSGMYPGFKTEATDPDAIAEDFIEFVMGNLRWVYNQVPPEIRDRSRLWYKGARAIAERLSADYGLPDYKIAGVLAALSPQKDWYQNVSLAERVLDIYSTYTTGNGVAFSATPEMAETAQRIYGKEQYAEAVEIVTNSTLSDLTDPVHKAMWVRIYDETYIDRGYRIVSSEGNFMGEPSGKVGWGSNVEIAKAIRSLEAASRDDISAEMGTKHKVRNFFNNILAPDNPHGDVTIDTHAVAASLLQPLSGNSPSVHHNFGSSPAKAKQPANWQAMKNIGDAGSHGSYGIYAEAHRRLAAELGILPRELQSITWEAVRGVFSPKQKSNKAFLAEVDSVWSATDTNSDLDAVRSQIVNDIAGGINDPTWLSGPDSELAQSPVDASYSGELAEARVSRRTAGQLVDGDGGSDGAGGGTGRVLEQRAGAGTDAGAGRAETGGLNDQISNPAGVRRAPDGPQVLAGREVEVAGIYGTEERPIYEVTDPAFFQERIAEVKASLGPVGAQVTVYDDYAGKRLFLMDDGQSGFALDGDDIISVFASMDAPKGVVQAVMPVATELGGARLDAFNTFLPGLYAAAGFRAVAKTAFSRQYSPPGWDYDYFASQGNSDPDIMFMVYDPENANADTDNVVPEYDDGTAAQQAEIEAMGPRTLNQDARGIISIPPEGVAAGRTVIELGKNADLSTFLHESGHFFLEAFQALATSPNAPQSMKDDLAKINEWVGRDPSDTSTYTTEQQEQWAEGFEKYLMEGKAPSPSLKAAFARMARWLTYIYKQAINIGPDALNDDIRGVMDRMLATDAELAEVAATYEPVTVEGIPGMSAEEVEPYRRAAERADAEAQGRLLNKMMAKVRRSRTKEHKARVKAASVEIEEELLQRPEYQLINALGGLEPEAGQLGARIDRKQLIENFGEAILEELSRSRHGTNTNLYIANGADMDLVAESFGYPNAFVMINTLRATPPLKKAVQDAAEAEVEAAYGDPLSESDIREEAEAALKNPAKQEVVAREAASLNRQAGGGRQTSHQRINAAAKEKAEVAVSKMTVREIMGYRQFLRDSQKHAREAQRQLAKVVARAEKGTGTATQALRAAAEAKTKQLQADHMYRAARERTLRYDSAIARFKRLNRATTQKNIGPAFMDAIDTILDKYDLRTRGPKDVSKQIDLVAFHTELMEGAMAAGVDFDGSVVVNIEKRHFTTMRGMEMDAVIDTVDNLIHLGRSSQKLEAADKKFDLVALFDTIADRINKNIRGSGPKRGSEGERGVPMMASLRHLIMNMDGFLDEIDYGQVGQRGHGPTYETVKAPLDRAEDRVEERMEQAYQDMTKLYDILGTPKQIRKLQQDKKVYPELGGARLSKMDLIVMALNTGNEGNGSKLDEEFGLDNVSMVLNRELTTAQWQHVQAVWDYLDGFGGELDTNHRKLTGLRMARVKPKLMIDGAPDFVTGGYYPLRYHAELSSQTETQNMQQSKASSILAGKAGFAARAQTARGHALARQQIADRPISLHPGTLTSHVHNVVRDLEMAIPIQEAGKVLYSQQFKDMLTEKGRGADTTFAKAWLEDVAAGDHRMMQDNVQRTMRFMHTSVSMQALAGSIGTAVAQTSGIVVAMAEMKMKYIRQGVTASITGLNSEAMAKSQFMTRRIQTFDRSASEMNDRTRELVQDEGGPLQMFFNGLSRAQQTLFPAFMWIIQQAQFRFADVPSWNAAYIEARDQGKDEQAAIEQADRFVRTSQGSGRVTDRTMVERGRITTMTDPNILVKMMTVMYSFMGNLANRVRLAGKGVGKGYANRDVKLMLGQMTSMIWLGLGVNLVDTLVREGAPDEEEDETWGTWSADVLLWGPLGFFPIARDAKSWVVYGGGGSPVDRFGQTVAEGGKAGVDIVMGEGDVGDVSDAVSGLGALVGLPLTALTKTAEDYAKGDEEGLARRLGLGGLQDVVNALE